MWINKAEYDGTTGAKQLQPAEDVALQEKSASKE